MTAADLLSLNTRELSAYLDGKGKTVAADLLDFGAAHRYRPFPSLEGTGVVASVLEGTPR